MSIRKTFAVGDPTDRRRPSKVLEDLHSDQPNQTGSSGEALSPRLDYPVCSQAKQRARPDSDIDVAVRADKPGWVGTRRVPQWKWELDVIGAVGKETCCGFARLWETNPKVYKYPISQ